MNLEFQMLIRCLVIQCISNPEFQTKANSANKITTKIQHTHIKVVIQVHSHLNKSTNHHQFIITYKI